MKINFNDLEFLFEKTSKQQVEDIFEWKCKSFYKLNPNELNVAYKYLVLPVILDIWKDIDNDFPLHNVLKYSIRLLIQKMEDLVHRYLVF